MIRSFASVRSTLMRRSATRALSLLGTNQTPHLRATWRPSYHRSAPMSTAPAARATSNDSPPTSTELKPGQTLHGFTVNRVEPVPEMGVVATLLRHDVTGAQLLHLARDDPDNTFAVAFRTTPMDSTGVPHILEHTVLCGSTKYPVRDPFFKMLNRSMATFMNAMTASDWTMYPFSTQNSKDFDNLLDVYLDAAFFPNLRRRDFEQEGWRLEHEKLDDPTSPIIIKGVVFNEMKGVFSDSSSLFNEATQNRLLPSHTYGVCSGGDPLDIPALDWEGLKAFHSSHYHPSNALFVTYGDQPLEGHLKKISRAVMSKFTSAVHPGTEVPSEPRWTQPRTASIACAPDPMAAVPGKETVVSKSYLVSSVLDDFDVFCAALVCKLLVESETSPFYRALLESGLGSDYSPNTGFDTYTKDTSFSVGLQGVAESDADKVVSLIDSTWDKVVSEGFEDKDVDAVLHQIELKLKHQTTNFGLRLIYALIPSWNHGGDPVAALKVDEKVERFRKLRRENPKFLQDFVRTRFKENPHCLTLTMKPSPSYTDELAAKEAGLLKTKLVDVDDNAAQRILQSGRELAAEQSAEEDLSSLPSLTLKDVDRDIERDAIDARKLAQLPTSPPLRLVPQPTNGVTYLRLLFSLRDLPPHLRRLAPTFANVLTQMGAGSMDYLTLSREIDLCSGGFHAAPLINAGFEDLGVCEEALLLSSHALDRNFERTLELWAEILTSPRWTDAERLATLVKMAASEAASSVLSSGHSYAMRHSSSTFSPAANANEVFNGISQVATLKELAARVEKEGAEFLLADLRAISDLVLRNNNVLRVAINSSPDNASSAADAVESFVGDGISRATSEAPAKEKAAGGAEMGKSKTQFKLPFQVNFVSTSFATVPFSHPDCAPLRVLSKLLSWKFLHREIREKGGAYGGGANASTDGAFSFYSYRDPRSLETARVFEEAVEWIVGGASTAADLDEAKMSLFQQLDKPVAPGSRGSQFTVSGLTDELRQEHRDRIFGAAKEDVVRVAAEYLKAERGRTTLLGPENEKVDETWTKVDFK